MRLPISTVILLILGSSLGSLAYVGCAPKEADPEPEVLLTEDVGGAIDAELSTEEDPRGPRTVGSRQVLPAGFPVELPAPAGTAVVDQGTTGDGESFVVLEASIPAPSLASGWAALLEEEGWGVQRSGERLSATRGDLTITASVGAAGAAGTGSRLRIVY